MTSRLTAFLCGNLFFYSLCLVSRLWLIAPNAFIKGQNAEKHRNEDIDKTMDANTMATVFQIRRERRFLIASCSFILDHCSGNNSLTNTSNISASRITVSASGTDKSFCFLRVFTFKWTFHVKSQCADHNRLWNTAAFFSMIFLLLSLWSSSPYCDTWRAFLSTS